MYSCILYRNIRDTHLQPMQPPRAKVMRRIPVFWRNLPTGLTWWWPLGSPLTWWDWPTNQGVSMAAFPIFSPGILGSFWIGFLGGSIESSRMEVLSFMLWSYPGTVSYLATLLWKQGARNEVVFTFSEPFAAEVTWEMVQVGWVNGIVGEYTPNQLHFQSTFVGFRVMLAWSFSSKWKLKQLAFWRIVCCRWSLNRTWEQWECYGSSELFGLALGVGS